MAGRFILTEIGRRMSDALGRLRGSDRWVVITRGGEAIGALVSMKTLEGISPPEADRPPRVEIRLPETGDTPAEPPEDIEAEEAIQADALLREIEAVRAEMGMSSWRS